jgi:hypothetical protein
MKKTALVLLSGWTFAFALSAFSPGAANAACPGDKKPSLSCPGDKKPSACPDDKKKPSACPDDKKKPSSDSL